MKSKTKTHLLAASLFAPALFIAGCGGSGSNSGGSFGTPTPTVTGTPSGTATVTPTSNGVAPTALIGVTTDGRLISFNSQNPGAVTTLTLTGVTNGTLLGIDYRFAPDAAAGSPGLYGIAGSNGNYQLYRIAITGTAAVATAVGAPITVNVGTDVGFDFNPNVPSPADATVRVDRIRLVGSNRTNLRIVPNTGAVVDSDAATPGTQLDGTLTYGTGDSNAGRIPRVIGAAYNNNDSDLATGTVNYAIDIATGSLVTQGRPAGIDGTPAAISPNTGQLFTVGRLGVPLINNLGFDIAPGSNLPFLSVGNNLYTVNLSTGAARALGTIAAPSGTILRGLAVSP